MDMVTGNAVELKPGAAPDAAAVPRTTAPRPITGLAQWLMPTIGNLCLWLLLFLLWTSHERFLADSDTGWHIRNGDLIRQTQAVPKQDPFSFSMAGEQWFAWEWLTDVLMSFLHGAAGLSGLVAAAMLILGVSYLCLHLRALRLGADPMMAGALLLFGAFLSIMHWLARPHVFSILFLAIWCWLFERYRHDRQRWLYLAPLLTFFWANLHGAFVISFVMTAVYFLGEWVEHGLQGEWWGERVQKALTPYVVVGVSSFLVTLVNPYGLKLYTHLFGYLSDNKLLAEINEFQSVDFHSLVGKLLEVFLLLAAVTAFRLFRQRRLVEVGLLLLWAHMSLQSARHVPLAVIVLLPMIAVEWGLLVRTAFTAAFEQSAWLARFGRACLNWYDGILTIDRQLKGSLLYVLTFAGIFIALLAGNLKSRLPQHFAAKRFPVTAAKFIEQAKAQGQLPGNVFAHDQYGGYLIYRFAPELKVFIDGRSDFYKTGPVLADYDKLAKLKPEWAQVLEQYKIGWMVLKRDEPLALLALQTGQWATVHTDETAQILVKK